MTFVGAVLDLQKTNAQLSKNAYAGASLGRTKMKASMSGSFWASHSVCCLLAVSSCSFGLICVAAWL